MTKSNKMILGVRLPFTYPTRKLSCFIWRDKDKEGEGKGNMSGSYSTEENYDHIELCQTILMNINNWKIKHFLGEDLFFLCHINQVSFTVSYWY